MFGFSLWVLSTGYLVIALFDLSRRVARDPELEVPVGKRPALKIMAKALSWPVTIPWDFGKMLLTGLRRVGSP